MVQPQKHITREKPAFTVDEFCAAYGVGRSLFYQEVKAGHLAIRKVGRRTLVHKTDADAWLDSLPSPADEVQDVPAYVPVRRISSAA